MKIAFDAKRATHNGTGLGNYSRYVINGLVTSDASTNANKYLLYTPGKGRFMPWIADSPMISFHYPEERVSRMFPSLWRTYGVTASLQREKVDVFHGLSNELPLNMGKSGIPSVVTIHDLIFLRYPQFYSAIDRRIYAYKFRQACRQATRIIAVSETTRREIVSCFHIPESKIEVVYQGCDAAFHRLVPEEEKRILRDKYGIGRRPFLLYVGTVEERKNLLLAVKALKGVEDVDLVAIGRHTPYTQRVKAFMRENGLEERVRLLDKVPFAELPAFYQAAELFVYPSLFEGFGIPVLEALASHTPVIAATGSCLEEAGGAGSLYTNPADKDELCRLIRTVLSDPALAASMRQQGAAYAQRFDASHTISRITDIYKSII